MKTGFLGGVGITLLLIGAVLILWSVVAYATPAVPSPVTVVREVVVPATAQAPATTTPVINIIVNATATSTQTQTQGTPVASSTPSSGASGGGTSVTVPKCIVNLLGVKICS